MTYKKFSDLEAKRLRIVPGTRKKYDSDEVIAWECGVLGSGFFITVQPGVAFDVSVPRCLEWLCDPHNRDLLYAAAIHDELLKLGFDEAFSSSEFRRALKARGKDGAVAWTLFFLTLVWTSFSKKG